MSAEKIAEIAKKGIEPISEISKWMLITAGTKDSFNTMTASWGSIGILWRKPVATIYVRPNRYTYEFLERNDLFTLSFYDETYHEKLSICGTKSGRDIDKVKECGFTVKTTDEGAVYFEGAKKVLVCKKLYSQDILPEKILDNSIINQYPMKDFHRIYIGEILEVIDN